MIQCTFLSDTHFGHPRLDPSLLYARLHKYFFPQLAKSQVLFFAGDLFHLMLFLSHPGSYYAILFLKDIISLCKKNNIKVRFIRGTFSHDRDQQSIINVLNREVVDFRVINDIEIEELSDWNNGSKEKLKVVYVPDSLPYKNSGRIIDKIKELYSLCGWSVADLMVGHGTFAHTLPDNISLPHCTFTIDQFKDIISGSIVMGHIHTPSKKANVWYVGSFDRMAHGEEERKGFLTCIKDKEHWKFSFIENPEASKFLTLIPKGQDKDTIIASFIELVKKKFPDYIGNVRILHSDPEIKSILNRICSNKFPNIRFTAKSDKIQKSTLELSNFKLEASESEVLDLTNLCTYIKNGLQEDPHFNKFNFTQEVIYEGILKLGVTNGLNKSQSG